MDFNVIRRKPPPSKPQSAPKKPPSPPPPLPQEMPPPHPHGPYPPYTDERDSRHQRMRSIEYSTTKTWRLNAGEYPDECHYGNYEYTYQPFGVHGTYKYDPNNNIKGLPPPPMALPPRDYHHEYLPEYLPRMALPPPDYHQEYLPEYPPRMALPPPDYHHEYLPEYPPRLALHPRNYHHARRPELPPLDYYKCRPMELPRPQPVHYYYPPMPYYGGLFSDENPNGCRIV